VRWNRLFNLQGLNYWLVAAGVGANLIWMFLTLLVAYIGVASGAHMTTPVQLGVLLSAFGGPFLIGFGLSRMAGDGRGPTYGLVSSLSALALAVIVLVPTGVLGVMVAFVILAGGLNGGLVGERRQSRR
jgi:hypothetical protein